MHRPTPRILALATTLTVLAVGCTKDPVPPPPITDPPTTSTTAPDPESTPDPKIRDEAAAAAAYEHYFDRMNDVRQRQAVQGWRTDLLPLTTGDHQLVVVNLYSQLAEQGIYATGASELVSMTPTSCAPDPTGAGHQQVAFDVCIDATDSTEVLPDGTVVSFGTRVIETVMMQKMGERGWLISKSVTQEGTTC